MERIPPMVVFGRKWTPYLTIAAMVAFAANSILTRAALLGGTIDAASFSSIRLATGAGVLLLISGATGKRRSESLGSGRLGTWKSALVLFLYAAPFSFAYLGLTTGTGALILFGFVQLTMIAGALLLGERPSPIQWLGLTLAVVGLVYLVLPGVAAPSLFHAALMALAGCSWGVYSLLGRNGANPLARTSGNFARSVTFAVVLSLIMLPDFQLQSDGVLLASASGALASGLGYVIWYAALGGLTSTKAAIVQLSVPVIAAAGGVIFLAEPVTSRLSISAILILGGVGMAVSGKTNV